jgi:hypothetical protein
VLPGRPRTGGGEGAGWLEASHERDLAAELDDRAQLRALFEGLRGRLSGREREAAVLCYLQGLSRAEAAERMGVSETRMRKVMEGRGPGRPGVAGKVGALIDTIRAGGWCEEQGSLMRGFAFGMLDPDGERHRLAVMHTSECPACRAYVASLRGLAAALPPVVLPWGVGAGALAGIARASSGGPVIGPGVAATGGGWALGGGAVGAKLAAGCLLTISIGAGCIALGQAPGRRGHAPAGAQATATTVRAPRPYGSAVVLAQAGGAGGAPPSLAPVRHAATALSLPARAAREFGLEAASSPSPPEPVRASASASGSSGAPVAVTAAQAPPSSAAVAGAAREFGPG